MKHTSYRDRDHAFGQRMLALRTLIGLSQAGLAERLGVSRNAIGAWEAGQTYPKAKHLQELIALAVQQQTFPPERIAEEARALWRGAGQKMLLDEQWLAGLLGQHDMQQLPGGKGFARSARAFIELPISDGSRLDWHDALDVPTFYGRAEERDQLARCVLEEHCRVVSVLGIGGVGKSALTVTIMREVAGQFNAVIWRSLRDAPVCATLLESCLQVLAPQTLQITDASFDERMRLLMAQLRERRVLLVLDNAEMLLEEGASTGQMRPDFQDYARLFRQIGETVHQSCLLLTSREKLRDLVPLEGNRTPVRVLRLTGLDSEAGIQLLQEKDLVRSVKDEERLVALYNGNPLALKIVAQTIVDLFGGEIAPFLAQGEVVFGGVRNLLREQFQRLSSLEQTIVYWLAILREPANLRELLAVLHTPHRADSIIDALERLGRRSLVERGQRAGTFTLQSVVLEYATDRLIAQASSELAQDALGCLVEYSFTHASSKDFVRRAQEQLLLLPLLHKQQLVYPLVTRLEEHLLGMLDQLRNKPQSAQGYGPANLLALLRMLRGHLRGMNLVRLALRGMHLQGVELQDAQLSGVVFRDGVFTDAFDDILAVAISSNGTSWAGSSRRGEIRIWEAGGVILRHAWRGHTDMIWALEFSPDGHILASGCWDGTIRFWDVVTGVLRWEGRHGSHLHLLAFAPDSSRLASTGPDATVRLWDVHNGVQLEVLSHPASVLAVTWSFDGRLLISGGDEGTIWIWEVPENGPAVCIQTLAAHAGLVDGLAIAPDGRTLASASWDYTVKLWDIPSGRLLRTLSGHSYMVRRVAWSPDGRFLASCSFDKTIWLWSVEQECYWAALQGHSAALTSFAISPDGASLLSSSEDGTVRVWDIAARQCLRVMQGYVASLYDLAWSADGAQVVSGGTDRLVTIYAVSDKASRLLDGDCSVMFGVTWSPDGRTIASSEWVNIIRLWDVASATYTGMLQHPEDNDNYFYGVAWSPDGTRLACGTARHGVQVWDMATRRPLWAEHEFPTWIRPVAWSPDSTHVAGGGDDGVVYVWDASNGTLIARLAGHTTTITSVAWSSNGTRLASGGRDGESGELFVWDAIHWERIRPFVQPPSIVSAITWGMSDEIVISGGGNGNLYWWNLQRGEYILVHQAHQGTIHALKRSPDGQRLASCGDDGAIMISDIRSGELLQTLRHDRPYERMVIDGVRGLTKAQRASLLALGAIELAGANAVTLSTLQ